MPNTNDYLAGIGLAERTQIKARRYRVNLTVTKFNHQSGNEIYLLDLDHAGANLETPFPLSPEYPVEFSFFLPGATTEIQVSGRVLWKQQLTIPHGRYLLSIQFYSPRWDLDKLLHHDLHSLKRSIY